MSADAGTEKKPLENANLDEDLNPNPNEESPASKNTPFVVKRLVGQRDTLRKNNTELDGENDDLAKEVARLTQENQRLAQGQKPQQILPPDFDDFESKEEYRQAVATYTAQVAQHAAGQVLNNQVEGQRQTKFDSRVEEHYQQAEKLGKRDYEQAEVNAINELGQTFVNQLVDNTDNSAEVLYMLGSSKDELKRIKALLSTNPVKATLEIGRLSANAGSFVKQEKPAPEDNLEPGSVIPSAANANLQKKYDEVVKKAADTGDTTGLRAIRKQMREAGLL